MTNKAYMYKAVRIFILSAFLLTGLMTSCKKTESQSFTGIIEDTSQAKHVPSLCYSYTFTRSDNGQQFGIRFKNNPSNIFSEQSFNKMVEINGQFVTKKRKFNAVEQHPVDMDSITCHYFSVSKTHPIQ